jgi:hypothetical protein
MMAPGAALETQVGLHRSPRMPRYVGATPDGWDPDTRTVLEVKCPYPNSESRTQEERMMWDRPPAHYIAQTLMEAHVMRAERIHFICYVHPAPDEEQQRWTMSVLEYTMPENLWNNEIWPEIEQFCWQVKGLEPPPPPRQRNGRKQEWQQKLEEGIHVRNKYYFSGHVG